MAGLIFQGYPGVPRSVKQLQASSELLYDVFTRYDPDNLLVTQAHREVLERQLEQSRLGRALDRIAGGRATVVEVERPTPLAFPLLVDRAREQLTSEKLVDRIKRLMTPLETCRRRRDRTVSRAAVTAASAAAAGSDGDGPSDVHLELAGEPVRLLPERALFWPAACALVVADVHWGKAATFRAAGIPIPGGATREDLDRLDQAVGRTGARRLIVLGDLFHARAGRIATRTLADLRRWRESRDTLEIQLVRGNHDRHAGDPPTDLRINCVDAPAFLPPFVLRHQPAPAESGLYPGRTRAPRNRSGRAGPLPRASALLRGRRERGGPAGLRQLYRAGHDHPGAGRTGLRRRRRRGGSGGMI